jgi:hypothetical protein
VCRNQELARSTCSANSSRIISVALHKEQGWLLWASLSHQLLSSPCQTFLLSSQYIASTSKHTNNTYCFARHHLAIMFRWFHWIGVIFIFLAAILLLISTISAPVIGDIGILKVMLKNQTDIRHSSVTFGTFGHCVLDVAPVQYVKSTFANYRDEADSSIKNRPRLLLPKSYRL